MIGARISTRTSLRSCRRNRLVLAWLGGPTTAAPPPGITTEFTVPTYEQHAPGNRCWPRRQPVVLEFVGGKIGKVTTGSLHGVHDPTI